MTCSMARTGAAVTFTPPGGGPIVYNSNNQGMMIGRRHYVGSQDWSGGMQNGDWVANVLLYNRDIGQDLSAKIVRQGFLECPLPFVPFQRRFFTGCRSYLPSAADSLVLSDGVTPNRFPTAGVSDSLSLADVETNALVHAVTVSDSLSLSDAKTTSQGHAVAAADEIALSDM